MVGSNQRFIFVGLILKPYGLIEGGIYKIRIVSCKPSVCQFWGWISLSSYSEDSTVQPSPCLLILQQCSTECVDDLLVSISKIGLAAFASNI